MPTNEPRPSKTQRREEARAKALALKQEQERRAKRNRVLAVGGLAVAVVALVAVVFSVVRQGQQTAAMYADVVYGSSEADSVTAPALADVTSPAVADETGGIPVSAAGVGEAGEDDVVVSVYFDFMCPYCGQFDAANNAELEAMAAEDGVTVLYKPISFLDGASQGASYSTRATNALAVVADEDPEHLTAFMTALYENQPAENTKGLTDDEIASIAQEAGVPATVTEGFTATVDGTYETADGEEEGTWRTFAPWVAAATAQAGTELGSIGTPTVLIDGTKWEGDLYTTGPLTAAVAEAVAAKG